MKNISKQLCNLKAETAAYKVYQLCD